MKNSKIFQLTSFTLLYFFLLISSGVFSQSDSKNKSIINDSRLAKNEFIKADKLMSSLFNNAYAYVIFPNVGKGGLGVGGAFGNGAVFQRGKVIGTAKLSQVTVGFQAGGQAYREVIFFESAKDLIRFKENKIEFSAQASAVAATEGASGNAKYVDGVMIFSQTKGGRLQHVVAPQGFCGQQLTDPDLCLGNPYSVYCCSNYCIGAMAGQKDCRIKSQEPIHRFDLWRTLGTRLGFAGHAGGYRFKRIQTSRSTYFSSRHCSTIHREADSGVQRCRRTILSTGFGLGRQ